MKSQLKEMNEDKLFENMVRSLRKDFVKGQLTESMVAADPFLQFSGWLATTLESGNDLGNAMVLSTVDGDGMPSSRVMLLRDVSYGGLTFFTNYNSRKGKELEANPKASVLFFWPDQERQIRVQGTIEKLPPEESDKYFNSRPFESQVGAWASSQSEIVADRKELDQSYDRMLVSYKDGEVPRPQHWGGYVLVPAYFEFWQGRASRLHDRLCYRKENGKWVIARLMP